MFERYRREGCQRKDEEGKNREKKREIYKVILGRSLGEKVIDKYYTYWYLNIFSFHNFYQLFYVKHAKKTDVREREEDLKILKIKRDKF